MLAKFRSKKVTLALVLVLVLALVAGGTYAWFTDSVAKEDAEVEVGILVLDGGFTFDNAGFLFQPGDTVESDTGVVENKGTLALFAKVTLDMSTEFRWDTPNKKMKNPTDYWTLSPDPAIPAYLDETSLQSQVSASTGKVITWFKDLNNDGVFYVMMSAGTKYEGITASADLPGTLGNDYMAAMVNFATGWEATQAREAAIMDAFGISLDPADGDVEIIPAVTVPYGGADMNTIVNETLGVDYF